MYVAPDLGTRNALVPIPCSFIEENHQYKLKSRKQQHAQPSRSGAPSQDLMSFWGMLVIY